MSSHPLSRRVREERVAQVLQLIVACPRQRALPLPDDLPGEFDFWFDGGACRIWTGATEHHLADGTRVTTSGSLMLGIRIEFADGSRVEVRQTAQPRDESNPEGG